MFSIIVTEDSSQRFTLEKIHHNLADKKQRLAEQRIEIEPALYDVYLKQREITHKKAPRKSHFSPSALYPGSWYLQSIDDKYRRFYARTDKQVTSNVSSIADYLNKELSSLV